MTHHADIDALHEEIKRLNAQLTKCAAERKKFRLERDEAREKLAEVKNSIEAGCEDCGCCITHSLLRIIDGKGTP